MLQNAGGGLPCAILTLRTIIWRAQLQVCSSGPEIRTGVPDRKEPWRSISDPSARWRQHFVGVEAIRLGLHSLLVDDPAGIHVGEGLAGQAAAFLHLIDPRRKRLLHDPAPRTLQTHAI